MDSMRRIVVNDASLNAILAKVGWNNSEDKTKIFAILAQQLGYEIQG